MSFEIPIAIEIAREMTNMLFLELLSLEELERVENDRRHGFTRAERNGVVLYDYSQSNNLYGRIVLYCIKNSDWLLDKYDFPRHYNYGQIANELIRIQIMKKIN